MEGNDYFLKIKPFMSDYRSASPDRYGVLKEYARENRKKATLAEQILWEELRNGKLGIKFLRQHVIGDYIVDFVSRSNGLVIEVDGAYHLERQQEINDEIRTLDLERLGYHVIRFSNDDVMFNLDSVIEEIEKSI